jgi:hypothetical protein
MTSRVARLLGLAAVLVLVCGVAGDAKPTKQFTRPCEVDGDATGAGKVGVKAWSYGPMTMTALQNDLAVLFANASLETGQYEYVGRGRVLDTRLDFYFDATDTGCEPADWGETPGTDGNCTYCLILINGVFDQSADAVVFGDATEALLYDAGEPVHVGGETASLVVQFTDGDDGGGGDTTEPEKTYEACHDGVDNDGDGRVDCKDPNCKKVCP